MGQYDEVFKELEAEGGGLSFYRCVLCGHVVSVWDIREVNGCPKCKTNRIRPSDLSVWEKILQIVKHPAIWKWKEAGL